MAPQDFLPCEEIMSMIILYVKGIFPNVIKVTNQWTLILIKKEIILVGYI